MKILFLGNSADFCHKGNNKKLTLNDIQGYGMVYAYFIYKYMSKRDNVEIIFCHQTGRCDKNIVYNEDNLGKHIPEADHCIAFEQRTFFNRSPSYYNAVKSKIKGKITTICDNNYNIGPEDCTFYSVGWIDNRIIPKSLYVGWAAEPSECYINKDKNKLTILIDHSYYGDVKNNSDYSKEIIQDVCNYVNNNNKNNNNNNNNNNNKVLRKLIDANAHNYVNNYVNNNNNKIVRRFISGGVETLDTKNPWFEIYNRAGLNFKDACGEYNKAHIFIVTHQESLGLSVIEAAMAGALILIPNDTIKPWLVNDLNCIKFDVKKGIPWNDVMKKINPEESRRLALKYNYKDVENKIFNYLIK
jgi:hypothetical protein